MTSAARIPLVTKSSHPELNDLIEAVKSQRGGHFLNLYAVLANSEPICMGWLQLFTSIRQKSSLPANLRELAMLRVAVLNRAPYEFDAHRPFALAAGISELQLKALQEEKIDLSMFASTEAAVIAYTDAMTRQIQVSDAVFAPIRQSFDDQGVLELTVTIAGYNMVSRVLEALQIPHEA